MIRVYEDNPEMCPGLSSLFIQFEYNLAIINIIKALDGSQFSKKTKLWETPTVNLANLLDQLAVLDDIDLTLLDTDTKEIKKYTIDKYKLTPFNHQLEAIEYGLNYDKWLLLDPPGMGKTLSICLLAAELRRTRNLEHCFIICGINTLKQNWIQEISKYTDLSAMILGQRKTSKGKIVIGPVATRLAQLEEKIDSFFIVTNIETLRNDDIVKAINKNSKNKFDMLVVDEVHKCKNPVSSQGKNLLKLKQAKYKVAATGTLLLNDPLDAYVPLKWIGIEHSNYSAFKNFYCWYTGPFNNILSGFKNTSVLKDQLSKISLRRDNTLLDLPSKNIIDEFLDMDIAQKTFYENIVNGIKDQVDKVKMNGSSVLALSTRLRQATVCPTILSTENIPSAKLERAEDLIEQITSSNEKVVVFSIFKEPLYQLQKTIINKPVLIGTGDIPDEEISKNINLFQTDPKYQIFLGTISKMGTGVTLTAASYMILLDLPWTQAIEDQTEDRIWRIGTKKPVFIYRLHIKDTIDEHVLKIVQKKGSIADYIIDNKISENLIANLRNYIEDLEK